jgi:hypothetical protein
MAGLVPATHAVPPLLTLMIERLIQVSSKRSTAQRADRATATKLATQFVIPIINDSEKAGSE